MPVCRFVNGCSAVHAALLAASVLVCAAQALAAEGLDGLQGKIVFSSDRGGPWRIWIINADGTDLRQVTQGEEEGHDVDPMFSHDGKNILFSSNRGGKTGIWTVEATGGAPSFLLEGDQAEWSPNGVRVAFRRENKIWVRTLATGEEKCISPEDWPTCSGPA
ncbi:MAG: PD40 domain-containing protein, partial [Candidatus Hydrogenedentes bacterium]|nr:PD40 domain-containing protein [Candidatus Hydrogenedentota bacterium]